MRLTKTRQPLLHASDQPKHTLQLDRTEARLKRENIRREPLGGRSTGLWVPARYLLRNLELKV